MTLTLQTPDFGKLGALVNALGPSNRARLNAVAAKALEVAVRRHVAVVSASRHATATSLGARPSGHWRLGMRGIASRSDSRGGEVVVPVAGASRAYHDIELTTPTSRRGRSFLTIPKHPQAYAHTVDELRSRGWKIFRPGKKKILLGYRGKGDKPVLLFALAERVRQRQDPTLLPQQDECAEIVCKAMTDEVNRRIAAARGAK